MNNQQCVFCRIARGDIPAISVYQDDRVFAFLDVGPLAPGHTLIIPRDHYTRLHDMPAELAAALARVLGPVGKAILDATGAPAYNILNNNGRAAGQVVEHVHFHVIPRRTDDGILRGWPAGEYPPGHAENLAEDIRSRLQFP